MSPLAEDIKIPTLYSLIHKGSHRHLKVSVTKIVTIADVSQKLTGLCVYTYNSNLIPPTGNANVFLHKFQK